MLFQSLGTVVVSLALFVSSTASALPGDNRLVQPDSVRLNEKGQVEVEYSVACESADVANLVTNYDDTGDRVVGVGVVVSTDERNCKPGKLRRIRETLDPKSLGLNPGKDGSTFKPMPVANAYDAKLEQYLRTRLAEVAKLVAKDAGAEMRLRPETLRCLGYPSWEGNAKAVGTCLLEASDKDSKDPKVKYAIIVSDDTEHPNEHRLLRVLLISYLL